MVMVKLHKKKPFSLKSVLASVHQYVSYLNTSKFFAGVIMIILNIGSKLVTVQFNKSTEDYIKYAVSRQLLIFAMAWMATRDIYVSLGLTAVFIVLADHLLNPESRVCIIPEKYRQIDAIMDVDGDGVVSKQELQNAIQILTREKQRQIKAAHENEMLRFF